ncbi:MAG: hypothetical protein V5A43_10525 [Haloarculaceae archaeon]
MTYLRYVLRRAAFAVVSLYAVDTLAFLSIDGLARVSLRAVGVVEGGSLTPVMADVPLLMWSIMLIVAIGITLGFQQDVVHGYLDPRVGAD